MPSIRKGTIHVSIPRSGFCSFKHTWDPTIARYRDVSIPRSGFCSFKLISPTLPAQENTSFNPSVGILFIQALFNAITSIDCAVSIPRSGFCSFKPGTPRSPALYEIVSIPRSGFCSFKPRMPSYEGTETIVSIPRSGFCSFKLYRLSAVLA